MFGAKRDLFCKGLLWLMGSAGLFLYNEETNLCYFNPSSLESSEQYQLVGAVLGLAIYNFTILDVPFPPFLFRKLAAAAPPNMGQDIHQGWRPSWRPDIGDLGQYDPALARNLQQILDYEGNIVDDIGAVFQVDSVAFGKVQHFPLVPGGAKRIVNKKNREEYVDLYVDFLLDRSVRRQFEPFARGFFNVCGGNALSLFRGQEIELLIRGSGEVNLGSLRGSVAYENWKESEEGEEVKSRGEVEAKFPVVRWFWELMELSDLADQQRVLRWITGSDRIPATGISNLELTIQCLGADCERLPQSRTCFNMLQLWNYASRRCFINKFWYAVVESEGFGLK
jgi:E3 ubiquitin-protein ligase HECTD2